ncbi:MAG: MFS transporter [Pseudomonadota bacterium]
MNDGGTSTTPDPDPRLYRRWQIKILVATWLAYAGYYFCRKAFYVVKKDLGQALDLTSVDLAQIGTAYLVGYAIGQFSSAYFGRRLGPKRLLLFGMAISIACNVAFGVSNGMATIALFMTLNGMAQGTGWPGCIGSLGFWFQREQRGSIMGVWATCYQVGSVLATSFAAFLLGAAGWRSFFGASAVLLVVWAIVLWLHPNTPEDVGLRSVSDEDDSRSVDALFDDEVTDPGKVPRGLHSSSELGWSRDTVIAVLLMGSIYFCIKFLRYALWSWAPYFLSKNFGLAGDQAGYLSTVFDLCGFVGVLLAGVISDRLFKGRRAALAVIMLALMTASFGLMYGLGAHSVIVFSVSMGLAGFMLYGPDSLLSGVGAIDIGSVRGALVAAGIINGMGSIGPVFQEQIIGWLYKTGGQDLVPIFLMLVVVATVGTLLTVVLYLRARAGKASV